MFVAFLFMNLPMKPRYLLIKVLKKLNAAICNALYFDDTAVFCTFARKYNYFAYEKVLSSYITTYM